MGAQWVLGVLRTENSLGAALEMGAWPRGLLWARAASGSGLYEGL